MHALAGFALQSDLRQHPFRICPPPPAQSVDLFKTPPLHPIPLCRVGSRAGDQQAGMTSPVDVYVKISDETPLLCVRLKGGAICGNVATVANAVLLDGRYLVRPQCRSYTEELARLHNLIQ